MKMLKTGLCLIMAVCVLAGCSSTEEEVQSPMRLEPQPTDVTSMDDPRLEAHMAKGELVTDHVGKGTVRYTVEAVEYFDNKLPDNVPESELAETIEGDFVFVLAEIQVHNVDVPMEATEFFDPADTTINCLRLFAGEFMTGDPFCYNPVWFDNYRDDAQKYFHYALPAPGETLTVKLGWALPAALADEPLYLEHGFNMTDYLLMPLGGR